MEIGGIELNLSLSLNGRFGPDLPRSKDMLARSTSSLLLEVPVSDEVEECGRGLTDQMTRSCSLPTMHASAEEEEEEVVGRMKRKAMQSLKRMEVKKRRMEKQRIANGTNLRGPGTGLRFRRRREPDWNGSRRRGGSSVLSSELNLPHEKRRKASGMSSPPINGTGTIDTKSAEQMLRTVLEDMPCVCSKVDGPNGRRVEGFLFRYRKGEGIKIVCICHGRFFSPAQFVEHGGGSCSDVTNPLKHIIVCPPSW